MTDASLALPAMAKRKNPGADGIAPVVERGIYFVDAHNLRRVWDAEKRRLGNKISQKAMALEWGVNASLITQYLNGHIKLNTEAKLSFADYLKKPVLEIWPDFELAAVAPGELDQEAVMLATMWSALPKGSRDAVRDLIHSLSGAPKGTN
jgi:hypothetical protein